MNGCFQANILTNSQFFIVKVDQRNDFVNIYGRIYSMKYKLYTTSHKAWDGMIKEIKSAQKSIYLEMFICLNDTQKTHDFFGLFKAKAKAGVEVVIILDNFGSSSLPTKIIGELRSAGVEFLYFDSWFRRTHRKILVIDNKTAFLGGVNIEDKIRYWHDLQIRVKGRIVRPILKSFSKSYRKCGGKKESILQFSDLLMSHKIKAWITDNWPSTKKPYYLNSYYRQKIFSAKKLVQIVTPYLAPPRWLIVHLERACKRGVQVEIIIPQDTDVKPLNKINYLNCCRLSAFGVKFYLTPTMNHAKLMLIDDEEGVIGSQNMDMLSFHYMAEVGVFFRQKQLIADLKKIIEHWKTEATPFVFQYEKIKLQDKIIIGFFKLFYPIF